MHLDTRTLVVVAIFVALIPGVIGTLIWYTRQTCPGLGSWALGNLVLTLSLVLLSLRGIATDWSSIVLANALAVGAAILGLQGIRWFCGLRLYVWREVVLGVL